VSVNVGFRPGRKSGPRIEIEEVGEGRQKKVVCHQYGHAGGG
jgi:D-amino-acid oxidase